MGGPTTACQSCFPAGILNYLNSSEHIISEYLITFDCTKWTWGNAKRIYYLSKNFLLNKISASMHLFVSIGWFCCCSRGLAQAKCVHILSMCVCVCTKFGFDSTLYFRWTRWQNLQRHKIYGYFMAFSQNCIIFNKLKLNENQQRRAGACARDRAHHCNSNE